MATNATVSDPGHGGGGHGHAPVARLHEDLPHISEFQIKHPPVYFFHYTFLALLALLGLTVLLYKLDLSQSIHVVGINLMVAMLVAVVKAGLVVYFFMNIRGSTRLTVLWAALGFIWLLLLCGTFMDYKTRPETPGWQRMDYPLGASAAASESKTAEPVSKQQ
jgi:cytochrome c oxidase subunit IV